MDEPLPARRRASLLSEIGPVVLVVWGGATVAAVTAFRQESSRLQLQGGGCANGLFLFGFLAAALGVSWGILLIVYLCSE